MGSKEGGGREGGVEVGRETSRGQIEFLLERQPLNVVVEVETRNYKGPSP